jgi:hypothetical protein
VRLRDDARVGGEDAVDVAVDLADVGVEGGGERDRRRVGAAAAERRDVRVSSLMPWKPATMTIAPSSSASRRRVGVTSTMRADPCRLSVIMPACCR